MPAVTTKPGKPNAQSPIEETRLALPTRPFGEGKEAQAPHEQAVSSLPPPQTVDLTAAKQLRAAIQGSMNPFSRRNGFLNCPQTSLAVPAGYHGKCVAPSQTGE